jgi:histidine ammonia-lyase
MEVIIDGESLTIEKVNDIARNGVAVKLAEQAEQKIVKCRQFLEESVASGEAIYGVTTGIGEFFKIRISQEQGMELQKRIVYSHSAGTGGVQPIEVVRAAMVLRANTLSKGHSGVRLMLVQTLLDMINKGVTPMVYEKGSLGVSGDLSPMSQIAEVVMGVGEAFYKGERLKGGEAMQRAGIEPVVLSYKEGLGLINGSQMLTGQAALILYDAERILKNAMIASSMTIDALKCNMKSFDARLHAVRPFNGQNTAASNIRKLTDGSTILADKSGKKVQDGYSLRCTPQVIGPSIDACQYARQQVELEINSCCDNPLFFPDDKTYIPGGNFHSQNVGIAMDLLGIALAEIADISERHTNRLMNPILSGLPDFLVEGKGLNSGLMVAQYTAAALVSENKVLAHPASVDSISVSADQEDHVAMSPIAVRKCGEILQNVGAVLAVEMMSAAQAFEFRKPLTPGAGTSAAYDVIRQHVPRLVDDRPLHPDINAIAALIRSNEILNAVEGKLGKIPLTIKQD